MRRNHHAGQSPLAVLFALGVLLAFGLAACGSSGGAGSGSGSAPTPAPTFSQGYGTARGCPSDAIVAAEPPAANVTVTFHATRTPTVQVGDVIEIQFPFGLRWTGPVMLGGSLQLQTPAGYASPGQGMCIWRLIARQAGTTTLTFSEMALCLDQAQACPLFAFAVPVTIVVK